MQNSQTRRFNYASAAEYLGMSVRQLQRAVMGGRIAHYKLSGPTGPVSFSQAHLDEFLAAREVPIGGNQ